MSHFATEAKSHSFWSQQNLCAQKFPLRKRERCLERDRKRKHRVEDMDGKEWEDFLMRIVSMNSQGGRAFKSHPEENEVIWSDATQRSVCLCVRERKISWQVLLIVSFTWQSESVWVIFCLHTKAPTDHYTHKSRKRFWQLYPNLKLIHMCCKTHLYLLEQWLDKMITEIHKKIICDHVWQNQS